jgi:hypothetical protein
MSQLPLSRAEEILQSKIDGTSYDKPPLSRVEALLIELDTGGGGGGTTDYNQLTNKPTLNGVELKGNLTSKDVDVESDYDTTYDPEEERLIISQDQLDALSHN